MRRKYRLLFAIGFCIFLSLGFFKFQFPQQFENEASNFTKAHSEIPHDQIDFWSVKNESKTNKEIETEEPIWWKYWKNASWSSLTKVINNDTKPETPPIVQSDSNFIYPSSNYNGSTLDSEGFSTLADHGPTTGQPADRWNPTLPKFPNFEGHWFPKTSHSKLYFEVTMGSYGIMALDIVIERDADEHSRYFYVRCDGVQVHSSIIGTGFNDRITFFVLGGTHLIELEIYYGGWKEHGWKLLYFWPYEDLTPDSAQHVAGEFFPKIYRSTLQYWVECGDDTKLNIDLQRVNDRYARFFSVFINGNIVVPETIVSGGHQFEFDIGDYAEDPQPGEPIGAPKMAELKLQIRSGSFCEYGWRVNLCAIHYESVIVEVDYMGAGDGCAGHRPTDSCLEYLEAYYKIHGYERAEFQIDDELPHVISVNPDSFWYDYMYGGNWTYDYVWWAESRYVLFGHQGGWYGLIWVDLYRMGKGAFIGDAALLLIVGASRHEQGRRTALMHEFGHTVGIIERVLGQEFYCTNIFCCMATLDFSVQMYPFYCGFHWSTREDPLWKEPPD